MKKIFICLLLLFHTTLYAHISSNIYSVKICNETKMLVNIGQTTSKDLIDNDRMATGWTKIGINSCHWFPVSGHADDFYAISDNAQWQWSGNNYKDCMSHNPRKKNWKIFWKQDQDSNAITCPLGYFKVQTKRIEKGGVWKLTDFNKQKLKLNETQERRNQVQKLKEEIKYLEEQIAIQEQKLKEDCGKEIIKRLETDDPGTFDTNQIRGLVRCYKSYPKLADEIDEVRKLLEVQIDDEQKSIEKYVIKKSRQNLIRFDDNPDAPDLFHNHSLAPMIMPEVLEFGTGYGKDGYFKSLNYEFHDIFRESDYQNVPVAHLAWGDTFTSLGAKLLRHKLKSYLQASEYLEESYETRKYISNNSIHRLDEYGFKEDSPVDLETRKLVSPKGELQKFDPYKTSKLRKNLQKWQGDLTPEQKRVLQTVKALSALVVEVAGDAGALLDSTKQIFAGVIASAKKGTSCVSKVLASGDYGDFYELTTGRDLCTGNPLTTVERAISGVGLWFGSGHFIRKVLSKIGEHTGLISKASEITDSLKAAGFVSKERAQKVLESAKKWDNVKGLIHTVKGNYHLAADGTRKIVNGMHTKLGFENFLNLNRQAGKKYNIRNVIEFTAERIEAGGDILSQTLGNGVRRVQIPRDAWKNADAFGDAIAYTESGQRLKGIKTLWPESYDIQKIGDVTARIVESNLSARNSLIEATVDGIKINVRVDASGKVVTSYPAWKQ